MGGAGGLMTRRHCIVFVIGRTLPGMLFLVGRECVCLVSLRACFMVEFGAAIIDGASAMCVKVGVGGKVGVAILCSTFCSSLYSSRSFCGGM